MFSVCQLMTHLFRMYQDKLSQLKKQLQLLKEGTLPDYVKKSTILINDSSIIGSLLIHLSLIPE